VPEVNGRGSTVPAVRVEGVVKRFGATVALDGAGLEVPAGMVFGLLRPNGAGKTTLVRILATLLAADAGRAEVFGRDVAGEPAAVRELIGLTGQFAVVDELLTGRENLEMFGRLFKLPGEQARCRGGELLDRFGLAQAADRPARTYSGGMRRRLDIASSLLTRPQVLFLDVSDYAMLRIDIRSGNVRYTCRIGRHRLCVYLPRRHTGRRRLWQVAAAEVCCA